MICELLGVPHEDRDRFSYWSDAFLSAGRHSAEEMRSAAADFDIYMREHVAAKRATPGEDLLSELAAVVDGEDGTLSEGELMATGKGLLVAGHETTANMIGKMVSMLLADRSRWEQVLADPSLIRSAVEESLRFDANLGIGMGRYLLQDIEVAGEILPQGTTVMTNMSSANRDERTFTGAETMDLTRSPNPHITFGAGPHSCLGQALARTELQTALRVLTRRLPTLELDVDAQQLRRLEGLLVGGLEQVPVRW